MMRMVTAGRRSLEPVAPAVIGDHVARRERRAPVLAADEVIPAGRVERGLAAREQRIEPGQPAEQQPHGALDDASRADGARPRQEEMLDAPDDDARGPRGDAARNLVERAEQPAVARAREAREVEL